MLNRESRSDQKTILFATGDPAAAWDIGVAMIRGGFSLYLINDFRDVDAVFSEAVIDIFVVDISTLDTSVDYLPQNGAGFEAVTHAVLLNAQNDNKLDGRFFTADETVLVLTRETPPEFLVNALRTFDAFVVSSRQKRNTESLGATLSEGASRLDGGEVVVRSESRVGKIFFFSGKIAWVSITGQKSTLVDDLVKKAFLSKQDLKAVYEECKMSGRNFAETLVEWQIVERNLMRQILRDRIVSCIHEMSQWKRLQSIFVPQKRAYSSTLLFDMAELAVLLPDTIKLHVNIPFRNDRTTAEEQAQ